MDQKFREAQRAYEKDISDPKKASDYIRALEQLVGVRAEESKKVAVSSLTLPCILCEKELERSDGSDLARLLPGSISASNWIEANINGYNMLHTPSKGIIISSNGNYGSQVLDGNYIYFVMCDECLIKHSHKILHYDPEEGVSQIRAAEDSFKEWLESIIPESVRKALSPTVTAYFNKLKESSNAGNSTPNTS